MKKKIVTLMMTLILVFGLGCVTYGASDYVENHVVRVYSQTGVMRVSQSIKKETTGKVTTVFLKVQKSVPHRYVSYHVQYRSGKTAAYGYNIELSSVDGECVYMREFMNDETGKRDGFINTPIVVYANGEVRGNNYAYVVYSSLAD